MRSRLSPIIKWVGVIMMVLAYMALFYNASAQDNEEDIDWLSLILTLLLGINQGVEIHDHVMEHHHQDHSSAIELSPIPTDASWVPETKYELIEDSPHKSSLPRYKILLRGIIPLGLSGFAGYAIWTQAASVARDHLVIAVPIFIPNIIRFILLPGRHVKALVIGAEHELMHDVTPINRHQEEKVPLAVPIKKTSLFLLFSACHIVDSQLLANQSRKQSVIYWLSVLGLSGASACYHVNHALNIGSAYQMYQQLSPGKKCTAFFLAVCAGILHAGQPLLGLKHLIETGQPEMMLGLQAAAIAVEFGTGLMDALQHVCVWATQYRAVQSVNKDITSTPRDFPSW